jgi:CBS domain containing-hemolysin-like protein
VFDADGATRTDQLEAIGMHSHEGPYETLAGLVATELGRIPERGDSLDVAGWHIEVVDARGRRAARAQLTAPPEPEGSDVAAGEGGR